MKQPPHHARGVSGGWQGLGAMVRERSRVIGASGAPAEEGVGRARLISPADPR
ncbi:hypothetical protein [Piscinibacter gummiphilus]|uniref:Uncharacterized protein n=1 Tax=Piscinibacter gummiphilus TaxID=946333 RepID=A0ABZ0CQ61_9BURK|nr:hypothetical protein [Piscinibacter gummiphilus]WOB07014.1 hypothetical protein RXV79_19075 [Piscinibacter gummiphilus]